MSCCKITSVCLSFAAKCWRCFTNVLMTLRHCVFSRQHRTQFSEDIFAFVLWRYVAVQIWRVKELFVPGFVASTIKFHGVPIFVVFIEDTTHEFQYPGNGNFLYKWWKKILWPRILNPTNVSYLFNPRKLVCTKIKPSIVHLFCSNEIISTVIYELQLNVSGIGFACGIFDNCSLMWQTYSIFANDGQMDLRNHCNIFGVDEAIHSKTEGKLYHAHSACNNISQNHPHNFFFTAHFKSYNCQECYLNFRFTILSF